MKLTARRSGWRTWRLAAVVAGLGLVATGLALSPVLAGGHIASGQAALAGHSISPAMVACERKHAVCDQKAYDTLPLIKPDPAAGPPQLTRQRLLARYAVPGGQVVVQLTTYGRLRRTDPALAGSATINAARAVWVITQYFPKPVVTNVASVTGKPLTDKVFSFVIDAVTGQETDGCDGCAALPRERARAQRSNEMRRLA